jgi:phage-related protein
MQSLPIIQNDHKHQLASADPWLLFLEVDLPAVGTNPATTLRTVHNNEDVVYQGNTWTAFAFDIPPIDGKPGELPQLQVRVSNVNRQIHSLLESYDGGAGGTVTFFVVSRLDLSGTPAQTWTFEIQGATADEQWATFTLSATSPMKIPFPRGRYSVNHCPYKYNSPSMQAALDPDGVWCGYSGAILDCDHTLEGTNGCRAHANSARFGGHPSIDTQGFRFASVI